MIHEEKEVPSGGSADFGWTLCEPLEKLSCSGTTADAEDCYTDVSGWMNYSLKGAEQSHLDV